MEPPPTIRLKVEQAFAELARVNKAGRFDGLEIVEGHSLHQPKGPQMCFYCRRPVPHPELPPRSREYIAPLELLIERPSDEKGIARIATEFEALKDLVEDVEMVQAFMNARAAGVTDTRRVRGFHVIDIQPRDEDEDRMVETREDFFSAGYDIICADFDSPPE